MFWFTVTVFDDVACLLRMFSVLTLRVVELLPAAPTIVVVVAVMIADGVRFGEAVVAASTRSVHDARTWMSTAALVTSSSVSVVPRRLIISPPRDAADARAS